MSMSIVTNVNSLVAQENLRVNNDFQGRTIQRLTSGYRINSSGDDAAGLAIANKYRSDTAELMQGVRNANDGLSQLQIIDGGLNNMSKILDRLKTLATQSASTTFSGDRTILNNEFQVLLGEIDRQAKNIKLDTAGTYKTNLSIYTGGGSTEATAKVGVDLSGSGVDAASLNLTGTSVIGGGTGFASNTVRLDNPLSLFLASAAGNGETFTISYTDSLGSAQQQAITVDSRVAGYTGTEFIDALNSGIESAGISGITAAVGGDGTLQFVGGGAFAVVHSANGTPVGPAVETGATQSLTNAANYTAAAAYVAFASGATTDTTQTFTVDSGGTTYTVNLTSEAGNTNDATTIDLAISAINRQLAGSGVSAIKNGTAISLQGSQNFTVNVTAYTLGTGGGEAGSLFGGTVGSKTVTAGSTSASATGNALEAITALNAAVSSLGLVQSKVGTGQNQLQYAISLAQSQISSFSAAESRIRDADVASEAANLTKAQVLQQASLAAMAQANAAPQAVLALLRG